MAVNELLGKRIKALRCTRNYTQAYMADWIGVSMQKYARKFCAAFCQPERSASEEEKWNILQNGNMTILSGILLT